MGVPGWYPGTRYTTLRGWDSNPNGVPYQSPGYHPGAPKSEDIIVKLRYRGHDYQIEDGAWRGPDGHVVHLLTWITDDLPRSAGREPGSDLATARQVADRLGSDAEVIGNEI